MTHEQIDILKGYLAERGYWLRLRDRAFRLRSGRAVQRCNTVLNEIEFDILIISRIVPAFGWK